MVPFNAASKRTTNGNKKTNFTPGPGTYSASYTGFDQIKQTSVNLKTQKDFGVDELAISGIKPTSNFASKVPRFKDGRKPTNQNLGPGRYVPDDAWAKDSKRPPKPEFHQIQWQREANPPSIPSHDFVFGYEETNTGGLKRQKNPEKVTTGLKTDVVGPGQYNVPDTFSKTHKGVVKWKKSKSKRFNGKKQNQVELVGPGHYQVEKTEMFPIYKYKQSSVFASRVERATSVQIKKRTRHNIPVGRTRPITAYQKMVRGAVGYIGTELSSDDEGDFPGPGAYNNATVTAFNPKQVPQRQQFFGSTVARFDDKSKRRDKVGPGSYNYETASTAARTRASSHHLSKRPPFSSSGQRFEAKREIEEPGPGAYAAVDPEGQKENKRILPVNKNRAFGTTERRFAGVKSVETPGPGQYKPENNLKQLDKKKGGQNMKNSSSMFLSAVPRNPYNEGKKKVKAPAPGSYDVKQYTIEENVKKKAGVGFENPLLANLKAKTKANIPFSSNADRFKEKVDENEAWLAPGYYEHRTSFEENKNKQKGKPQNFLTASERFNNRVEQQKAIETPGPGYYDKEGATAQWFKRSFNMIFTE